MSFRIRIDDKIVVECDSSDEVRSLVGVLQLPFGSEQTPYVSSVPVNDQIIVPPGERVSLFKPRNARTVPENRRKQTKMSPRAQLAQSRRDRIVEFVKEHGEPVHRQEIVRVFGNETDAGPGWVDNALQKLIMTGRLSRTDAHGFYAYPGEQATVAVK